jgi:hypothetical protein
MPTALTKRLTVTREQMSIVQAFGDLLGTVRFT